MAQAPRSQNPLAQPFIKDNKHGALQDVSGDNRVGFEDTFLGDLLGFDGRLGAQGPGMAASMQGARRMAIELLQAQGAPMTEQNVQRAMQVVTSQSAAPETSPRPQPNPGGISDEMLTGDPAAAPTDDPNALPQPQLPEDSNLLDENGMPLLPAAVVGGAAAGAATGTAVASRRQDGMPRSLQGDGIPQGDDWRVVGVNPADTSNMVEGSSPRQIEVMPPERTQRPVGPGPRPAIDQIDDAEIVPDTPQKAAPSRAPVTERLPTPAAEDAPISTEDVMSVSDNLRERMPAPQLPEGAKVLPQLPEGRFVQSRGEQGVSIFKGDGGTFIQVPGNQGGGYVEVNPQIAGDVMRAISSAMRAVR